MAMVKKEMTEAKASDIIKGLNEIKPLRSKFSELSEAAKKLGDQIEHPDFLKAVRPEAKDKRPATKADIKEDLSSGLRNLLGVVDKEVHLSKQQNQEVRHLNVKGYYHNMSDEEVVKDVGHVIDIVQNAYKHKQMPKRIKDGLNDIIALKDRLV